MFLDEITADTSTTDSWGGVRLLPKRRHGRCTVTTKEGLSTVKASMSDNNSNVHGITPKGGTVTATMQSTAIAAYQYTQ